MSRRRWPLAALALVITVCVFPNRAHAVHKAWLLKNSGLQCAFSTPNPDLDNYYGAALANGSSNSRSVICPIALAGRWGSSNPVVAPPLWGGAYAANIYLLNNKPGTAVSCTVRARLGSGSIRYSRTVSTTAGGAIHLTPGFSGDWGGTLETYETDTLRSMDFDCSLPGNYSTVYGYRVRICQNLSDGVDCGDPSTPNGEAFSIPYYAGLEWVQTSGSECMVWSNNNWERGHFGGKNVSTNSGDWVSVYCPITPPAEDTNESTRSIDTVAVYYKPGQGGTIPVCQATWTDRWASVDPYTPQEYWSTSFAQASFPTRLERTADIQVRLDVGMAVYCDVPPGATIQGVTTRLGVAPVSGGG